jgi:hypothetical protein
VSTTDPMAAELAGDAPDVPMPEDHSETGVEVARRVREEHVSVMPLMTDAEMQRTWRLATALAQSRMFKDADQAAQAFAKILIGRDLGLSPTRALMTIDLVKGGIQLRGVLLAAWVRQSADYDYKIIEMTDERCAVRFLTDPMVEPWDETMVRHRGRYWEVLEPDITFTVEDAERAHLVKEDSNWEKYPMDMCFWRAMSRGVKRHAPEMFAGMPVYVEGEIPEQETTVRAPAGAASAPPPLPKAITELLDRVHAIDTTAWRRNEVLAQLPDPTDERYVPTVDGLVANIKRWLAEHEVQDAEVVEPEGQSLEDAEAAAAAETSDGADEPTVDQTLGRYRADATWREQVDALLNRRQALEDALENHGLDERQAAEHQDELEIVEGNLEGLGVPRGWFPTSDDQTSLEV